MPWEPILILMMGSLRAVGVIMALPAPGGQAMPRMVRIALTFMIGGLLASVAPPGETLGTTPLPGLAMGAFHEVLLGLAMGLVMRTVLTVGDLAGRLIAGEIGLTAAPGFDVPVPSQEPLPSFIGFFAGLLFFVLRGHEGVLAAFARSFELAPAGQGGLGPLAAETIVTAVATLMELAVRMAAPFIALNFMITFAFAILGRAVPKMNVFIISYAMRSLLGFIMLAGAGMLFARYLEGAFDNLPWLMLELVARR
jgi:flagellar biosynthetic protein FliR